MHFFSWALVRRASAFVTRVSNAAIAGIFPICCFNACTPNRLNPTVTWVLRQRNGEFNRVNSSYPDIPCPARFLHLQPRYVSHEFHPAIELVWMIAEHHHPVFLFGK
jgi:hypothetical protein